MVSYETSPYVQFIFFIRFFSLAAIPNRLENVQQDVLVQTERERELQKRFQLLQDKCFEASLAAP